MGIIFVLFDLKSLLLLHGTICKGPVESRIQPTEIRRGGNLQAELVHQTVSDQNELTFTLQSLRDQAKGQLSAM